MIKRKNNRTGKRTNRNNPKNRANCKGCKSWNKHHGKPAKRNHW